MDAARIVLPIILYILGSILLIILIILGVKMIITMNKIENVVDDVDQKVQKLNGLFSIIDVTTDRLSLVSDRVIDFISMVVSKLFRHKNKGKEEEENE